MKGFMALLVSAVLWTSAVFAQTSSSSREYLLLLHPELSQLMIGTIALGPTEEATASDGCKLTGAEDGVIVCLLADSCDPAYRPTCGIYFSGRDGLTLPDVAALSAIPEGTSRVANTLGAVELGAGRSFEQHLEALR